MPEARTLTAEEFLAQGGGRRELIAGEVVEMTPSSSRASRVAAAIVRHLGDFADRDRLGAVFGADAGFLLARDPDFVRVPDAAFVTAARAADLDPRAFVPFAPDLAVEVVSPSDSFREVEEKARMWLACGARLVWVVEPEMRLAFVHRPDGSRTTLAEAEALSGEDVLPGFRLPVAACL